MKKIIRRLIDITIIVLIIYLIYLIVPTYLSNKQTQQLQEQNMEIVEQNFGEFTCDADGYVYEDVDHEIDVESLNTNDVVGYVEIPKYNMKVPIVEGDTSDDQYAAMDKGVSHDPLSGLPSLVVDTSGESIVLAGHRNLSFQALKHVEVGDGVIVNLDNNIYLFEVTKAFEFQPEEVDKVFFETTNDTLVMYTCYPFRIYGPITGRYAVEATRVEKIKCN